MRLIDADALKKKAEMHGHSVRPLVTAYHMCVSVHAIDDAPTIEAEPVKHRQWVDRYGGKYVNPKYECSECRKEAPYRPNPDDLLNWYHEQDLSDYCPNCGAKMGGERVALEEVADIDAQTKRNNAAMRMVIDFVMDGGADYED